jgi:hypothetical protein
LTDGASIFGSESAWSWADMTTRTNVLGCEVEEKRRYDGILPALESRGPER